MAAGRIIIEAAQPSLDANANLINGATLTFLNADTLAPAPVYSDSTLATSLGNVVTASGGFFPDMWAEEGTAFRVEWRNSAGSLLRTFPRIVAAASSISVTTWAAGLLSAISAAAGRAVLLITGLWTDTVHLSDYVTPSQTATERRVAIQAAIDAAVARQARLCLSAGTHQIDGESLTVSQALVIYGHYSRSVITSAVDRITKPVFLVTGNNVILRDFAIASTFAGTAAAGSDNSAVTFRTVTDFEASNLRVTGNFYVGITVDGGASGVTERGRVTNNFVTGVANRGIYIYRNCNDVQVTGNTVPCNSVTFYGINTNPGGSGAVQRRIRIGFNSVTNFTFHGIGVSEACQDVTVIGNNTETTTNTATCILIQLANTVYAGRVTVTANTARGGNIGIYATETIWGLSVTANIVEDQTGTNAVGIWMSDVYYAAVANNYVDGTTITHGIYVSGSAVDTCRRISVVGNQVLGPTNGIYVFANVANATRDITVTANGTFGCSGNGLIANSNTDRVIMVANNSRGNGTNLTNAGTNAVTDNNMTVP